MRAVQPTVKFLPKQKIVAELWASPNEKEYINGRWVKKTQEIVFGGAKGSGKMVRPDEPVLTPWGYKPIKDLKVGSSICATDGSVQKVIAVHYPGEKDFYRITFCDGTVIDSCAEHLWNAWEVAKVVKKNGVKTCGSEAIKKWTTEDIFLRYQEPSHRKIGIPLMSAPCRFTVPVEIRGKNNIIKREVDPYFLGVLLGDGYISERQVSITTGEKEIEDYLSGYFKDNITKSPKAHNSAFSFRVSQGYVYSHLRSIGLMDKRASSKFIPRIYLHGTVEERFALLNGLMDTDGWVEVKKDENSAYAYYGTVSEQLRDDIMYLARSLGYYCSYTTRDNPKYSYKGEDRHGQRFYQIRIKGSRMDSLFRLKRKHEAIKHVKYNSIGKWIDKIEKIEPQEGICITVSNPNSLYLLQGFTVTHNSHLGCGLIFMPALTCPGTSYFIARKSLMDLKHHTIPSIKEWFDRAGLDYDYHCHYNNNENIYTLRNGSRVQMIHAKDEPGDPLFERFGSMQMTRGWIEEGGEFELAAKTNLRISIGRWKNRDYNLDGKLLITCNPKKNFLYDQFYKPYKEGTLPIHRKFIQSFPTDNSFLTDEYIENLRELEHEDYTAYQRLFLGNWDYDEGANVLFHYEDIKDLFVYKPYISKRRSQPFMTVDPSGDGKDRTVIMVYRNPQYVDKVLLWEKINKRELEQTIKSLQEAYSIPNKFVIYDDDGVGHYLGSYIPGSYAFKGNQNPKREKSRKEYPNQRTQMYYELAKVVRDRMLFINENRKYVRETIERELGAIKRDKIDDDTKRYLVKKRIIKQDLGASPDFADNLAMSRVAARTTRVLSHATV